MIFLPIRLHHGVSKDDDSNCCFLCFGASQKSVLRICVTNTSWPASTQICTNFCGLPACAAICASCAEICVTRAEICALSDELAQIFV
jgi:hypothetical protein